ncbi:protein kinase domain-containing protein [Crossiella sp. CA198]|uniref:protein kinase domain-containing protein n=1 Tax=Crossiella sp. CA198 TaxID=3455607 RepID=UPI003F8D462C
MHRGQVIAQRYQLTDQIGSGGMGIVWRATDLELGRVVALKRSQTGDNGQIRREARIGAGLHHPHVVTVFDVVLDGEQRWLVMEYLPSRSLAAIVAEDGPVDPVTAARIGAQLAGALAVMHRHGMVHRDVKPANVLLTEDGTAKLTDLGISRWSEVTRTNSEQVGGTVGYLAPEVANGAEALAPSDVFSLGATLFAVIEGIGPWGGEELGPYAQLRRAAAGDLQPARRAGPLTPVLTELLQTAPGERPSAARSQELCAAVVAAAETGEAVVAAAVPPTGRKPASRRRPLLLAALALVVTAAVVVLASQWSAFFPAPGPLATTAAERYGWGNPKQRAEFSAGVDEGWDVADARPGRDDKGRRMKDRVTVRNDALVLTGLPNGDTGYLRGGPGLLRGRWEARIRVPKGCACYRAILTLWPAENPGVAGEEIVFMENKNDANRQHVHFFLAPPGGKARLGGERDVDLTEWNHFAVEWSESGVFGYLNGEAWFQHQDPDNMPRRPMAPTIKLDFDPIAAPTPAEASMEIDWIREYGR